MYQLTVHDFAALGSASTARSALQLQRGRDLVIACSDGRWVTPTSTIDPSAFTLHGGRLFQYHTSPPHLTVGKRPVCVPDWGEPPHPDDPDHARLQDLQEFESTNFHACPGIGKYEPSLRLKRDNSLSVNVPAKRPRVEAVSLLESIPQPHFIPAPPGQFKPVDTKKIPYYPKAVPSPIAPYDAAAVDQLLSCRFRRVAWLIPVRGSLPWDGASTAVILDETQVVSRSPSPRLPVSVTQPGTIMWTPSSLQHLWSFLGSIRQARHLGPLSLSFHAVSAGAISARTGSYEPVWDSNRPYCPQYSSKHTSHSPDDFMADICRAHLEDADYIKIYHDVPYSLSLRNILDAYKYDPDNSRVLDRSGANDRKIRILKGAQLVLVDEHSKAIFLM